MLPSGWSDCFISAWALCITKTTLCQFVACPYRLQVYPKYALAMTPCSDVLRSVPEVHRPSTGSQASDSRPWKRTHAGSEPAALVNERRLCGSSHDGCACALDKHAVRCYSASVVPRSFRPLLSRPFPWGTVLPPWISPPHMILLLVVFFVLRRKMLFLQLLVFLDLSNFLFVWQHLSLT